MRAGYLSNYIFGHTAGAAGFDPLFTHGSAQAAGQLPQLPKAILSFLKGEKVQIHFDNKQDVQAYMDGLFDYYVEEQDLEHYKKLFKQRL